MSSSVVELTWTLSLLTFTLVSLLHGHQLTVQASPYNGGNYYDDQALPSSLDGLMTKIMSMHQQQTQQASVQKFLNHPPRDFAYYPTDREYYATQHFKPKQQLEQTAYTGLRTSGPASAPYAYTGLRTSGSASAQHTSDAVVDPAQHRSGLDKMDKNHQNSNNYLVQNKIQNKHAGLINHLNKDSNMKTTKNTAAEPGNERSQDSKVEDKRDVHLPAQALTTEAKSTTTSDTGRLSDIYFIITVSGLCVLVVGMTIGSGFLYTRMQRRAKESAAAEYPAYGVTGPNRDLSPSGDRKLAQSAQMYHYQHQKQQMLAMEKNHSSRVGSASDVDSDEDNEEGDYTVYECPGLAPSGEMEVKNPLFHDDPTPALSDIK